MPTARRGIACETPRRAPAGRDRPGLSSERSSAQLCSASLAKPSPGSSTTRSASTPAATAAGEPVAELLGRPPGRPHPGSSLAGASVGCDLASASARPGHRLRRRTEASLRLRARPRHRSPALRQPSRLRAPPRRACVSIETGTSSRTSASITGTTLLSSSSTEIRSAPGRVDSPPTSIRSAPRRI